jgi:hypothetical protein
VVRLYRQRMQIKETFRDLIEDLVAAVMNVDQWVATHHATPFLEPDSGA